MANQRKEGVIVRTYSVPADLHALAAARAAENGETLTAVIRRALKDYTRN